MHVWNKSYPRLECAESMICRDCNGGQTQIVTCFPPLFLIIQSCTQGYELSSKGVKTLITRCFLGNCMIRIISLLLGARMHFESNVDRWLLVGLRFTLAWVARLVPDCSVLYCFDVDRHSWAYERSPLYRFESFLVIIKTSLEDSCQDGAQGRLYCPLVFNSALSCPFHDISLL